MRRFSSIPISKIFPIISILLLIGLPTVLHSQINDSTIVSEIIGDSLPQSAGEVYNSEQDDFSPGLGLMVLLLLIFIAVCFGIGVILISLLLFLLFVFLGTGIMSTSILVGLHKRSAASGFKTLIVLTASVLGLFLGLTTLLLYNHFADTFTIGKSVLIGSLSGLISGLLLGLLISNVLNRLFRILRDRF